MNLGDVLIQVFQPYFYYSIIFLAISFGCIKIITKCCPFLSSRVKSLIYLIPVLGPLFIMLATPPKLAIQSVSYQFLGSFVAFNHQAPNLFSPFPMLPAAPQQSVFALVTLSTSQILSVTGILCITGLAIGGFYAAITLFLGDWLAGKFLRIINLAPDEYEWLQIEMSEIAKKLAIKAPQIALVEDLRPNAFTMGFGHKTRVVFTIGLLNVLNKEEIVAVASHELAHIKSHDFFFKTISNALTAVSFFNPLAYFSFFNAQREREMLADENGAKLLQNPDCLANALTKITAALRNFPREGRFTRLTSNLLVTSQIIHRPRILSAHPKIDLRLRNINQLTRSTPKHLKPNKLFVASILTCIVLIAGTSVAYALVNVQAGYTTPKLQLNIPSSVKTIVPASLEGNMIIINSSLTWTGTPQIASLLHLNPHGNSSISMQMLNLRSISSYQINCIIHQASTYWHSPKASSQPTIVYASSDGKTTTFVIKF